MALWCNGVDLTAGTQLVVHDWTQHGLQFTGAKIEKNNKPRTTKPNLLVWHWSGGEGGFKAIYRTLLSRKLGVHGFVDYEGNAFQFADLWTVQCAHAGRVNPRSIAFEVQNLGFGKPKPNYPRGKMIMEGHGRQYEGLMMTTAQLDTVVELTRLITESMGIPNKVPTRPDGHGPLLDYLPEKEQASFEGVAGHIHFSPKVCPGAQTLQTLWQEQDFE
jgi:hypothetical protein